MEIVTESKHSVCPKCKASSAGHARECSICGAPFYQSREKVFLRSKGASALIGRTSLYISAIAGFMVGMAEGFINEDSLAMTGNFGVSLGVLLMGPWCNESPRRALFASSALILAMYLFLHFTDLSLFTNWVELRASVIAFPLLALIFLFSLRMNK